MRNSDFEEVVRKQIKRGNGARQTQWSFGFQQGAKQLKRDLESLGIRVYLTTSGWFSNKVYYFRLVGTFQQMKFAINRVKSKGVDWT